jgi:lipopolysaccharide transport system permease protein
VQPSADSGKPRSLPSQWIHRSSKRAWFGPLTGAATVAADRWPRLLRSLEVLRVLVLCDFRARYRSQALGVFWSLLHPLVMMGILSIIFTQVFHPDIAHYPIFLIIGLVMWQWLSQSITAGTQTFVQNSDLVKRTVFARETLPIASVVSFGVNFLIESGLVLVLVFIFRGSAKLSPALLLLPVLLALYMVLLSGVALATSVLNVVYRDVSYIVNTGLSILYWVTPVMYSTDKVKMEPYHTLLSLNPAGAIIQSVRHAIMDGTVPSLREWGFMVVPTLLLFLLGMAIFRRHERSALDHV